MRGGEGHSKLTPWHAVRKNAHRKVVPNRSKILFPTIELGPLVVLVDVFYPVLRRVWVVLTAGMSQKSFSGVRFRDKKKGEKWAKMCFPGCALGPATVLKRMLLVHFVAILDYLDTLHVTETFGRAKKSLKCAMEAKDAAKGQASDQE